MCSHVSHRGPGFVSTSPERLISKATITIGKTTSEHSHHFPLPTVAIALAAIGCCGGYGHIT